MIVPHTTQILTTKGYRSLYSLPQGVPIIIYDDQTKTFKTIPLEYKVLKSKDPSDFVRVQIRQEFEQLWNNTWVASGGCNIWLVLHKKALIFNNKGIRRLKINRSFICVNGSSLAKYEQSKFTKLSPLDQLDKNKSKIIKANYKDLGLTLSDMTKDNNGYLSRPTSKGIITNIVENKDKIIPCLIKHSIISNGIMLIQT